MELIFIIVAGYLWYLFAQLKGRVDRLEERLGVRNEAQTTTPLYGDEYRVPSPTAQPQQMQTVSVQSDEYRPPVAYVSEPNNFDNFIVWLKKDFLMKVGALFLLMGMGWFVSYAFMNNWIGEAGRIGLGLLTGALILVLGVWRIRKYEHQGAVFVVLGSSTVLLTVFAARAMYDFFTPASALLLMFVTVAFVAFVSLRYERNSLALAGLILAGIAPYFTASPTPSVTGQFMYLFVIVLGTLWIVYGTGWRNLTLTALIIVFLETSPYIMGYGNDSTMVLLWVFLFVAIFFIANIISIIRVSGAVLSKPHLLTAFGTAMFLIVWVFGVAPEEWQSLLFVAWMLVFSFGSYIVFMTTRERIPFYVYGGTSVALLAAATTAELSGAVLTIAYLFEIAVLVIVAKTLNLEEKIVNTLSFLFAVPMILSLENISAYSWNTGVLHADFFVVALSGIVLALVGSFVYEKSNSPESPSESGKTCGSALLIFGTLYGLVLIWLVLHAILSEDIASMCALVIYTILGLLTLLKGRLSGSKELVVAGGALLGFVVVRLLLVDVWAMDLFGRIITFGVIGVLLVSTAFFRRSKETETTNLTA